MQNIKNIHFNHLMEGKQATSCTANPFDPKRISGPTYYPFDFH
jgi:hypothetical protein